MSHWSKRGTSYPNMLEVRTMSLHMHSGKAACFMNAPCDEAERLLPSGAGRFHRASAHGR